MSDREGDLLQAANCEDPFLRERKREDGRTVVETPEPRSCEESCEEQHWPPVWLRLDSEFVSDPFLTAGKSGVTCCCKHKQCVAFRKKRWCRRLFAIRVRASDYREGESTHVSVMEGVVRATLASRSHRDFCFNVMYATSLEAECVFLVLLADGEPPLTLEEVELWNDHAATICGDKETCCVQVMRSSCCLLRAQGALQRLLYLYGTDYDDFEDSVGNWPEGDLLHELLMELDGESDRSYIETGPCADAGEDGGKKEGTVLFCYPTRVWE